jgi:hypothetical protein
MRRRLASALVAVLAGTAGLAACGAPPTTLADEAADPDVAVDAGIYLLHATNTPHGNVPTWTSTDLATWRFAGDALPTLPRWAEPGWTWAPSAARRPDGRWVLFFSAAVRGHRTPNGQPLKCLGVASSASSRGPFVASAAQDAAPLLCQASLGGDIDPSVYLAPSGAAYLVSKVDGNSAGRPTTIENRRLAADYQSFAPGVPTRLLTSSPTGWEHGIVEGPDLVRTADGLHLLYSGGDYASAAYGQGQATCVATGLPCARSGLLLDPATAGNGAGGAAAFVDRTGVPRLAWHAYLTSGSARRSLLLGTLRPTSAGRLSVTVGLGTGVGAGVGTGVTAPVVPGTASQRVRPAGVPLPVPASAPLTVPQAHGRG